MNEGAKSMKFDLSLTSKSWCSVGARTYPHRKSIKLISRLFTESTSQVTLTLKRLDEGNLHVGKLEVGNFDPSTTTEDVLKWIYRFYTACQSKLEHSGTSLKF
jgi:hypothetical protein